MFPVPLDHAARNDILSWTFKLFRWSIEQERSEHVEWGIVIRVGNFDIFISDVGCKGRFMDLLIRGWIAGYMELEKIIEVLEHFGSLVVVDLNSFIQTS